MSDLNLSVVEDAYTVDGTPRETPLFAIKNSKGETLMETADKELAMLIGNASHVRTYLKHLIDQYSAQNDLTLGMVVADLHKVPGGL